jgi:hypothetical protein
MPRDISIPKRYLKAQKITIMAPKENAIITQYLRKPSKNMKANKPKGVAIINPKKFHETA